MKSGRQMKCAVEAFVRMQVYENGRMGRRGKIFIQRAVIICIFILFLASAVLAGAAEREKIGRESRRYIGTVAATDARTGKLIAKNWRGQTVFDTSAARFAGRGSLQEIEPGERVFIRYVEDGDRKVATSVVEAVPKLETEKTGAGITGPEIRTGR